MWEFFIYDKATGRFVGMAEGYSESRARRSCPEYADETKFDFIRRRYVD